MASPPLQTCLLILDLVLIFILHGIKVEFSIANLRPTNNNKEIGEWECGCFIWGEFMWISPRQILDLSIIIFACLSDSISIRLAICAVCHLAHDGALERAVCDWGSKNGPR